jgi:hypothetical protein
MLTCTKTAITDEAAARSLENVRAKNLEFYATDRGQGALKDLQQTFPHPWLYVGELLQNAVDAGAKHIRLSVDETARTLVVEHDGASFDDGHVEALCVRGMSKKGAGTVGFMGIGFKAVFQSFECINVSSGPWRFGFRVSEVVGEFGDRQRDWLGCVLPIYDQAITPPSPGMTCRFFLHDRLQRLGPIAEDVTKVLSADLLVLALLARRGVEEVEWASEHWLLEQIEEIVDEQITRVKLIAYHEVSEHTREWILFSSRYQPSRAAIARFLEHRQIQPRPEEKEAVYAEARRERTVEVFCPLDARGFPQPPRRGQAYALLPTGVNMPLGLHVQADWLLVTSRREIMEVETNEWHREMLSRLAMLVAAYLSWVTTLQDMPDQAVGEAIDVLPDWSDTDGAFRAYLSDPEFHDGLKAALSSLSFLPVRTAKGTCFATPADARLLPPILHSFDDTALLPWVLFGDCVLSGKILGSRTMESLSHLELLTPIAVVDLSDHWANGIVGVWREQLGSRGPDAHLLLLRALAGLDDLSAWRESRLRCLPAAGGGEWIDRNSAIGFPLEWDSVPDQDPALRSLLEPYLAPPQERLDWGFDRSLRRDVAAHEYVRQIRRENFEELMRRWWEGLPTQPDTDVQALILDVTCWVHLKQKQRANLVMRALCEDGTLAQLENAVLADPYASQARRRFFPKVSIVSPWYLHHKPGLSEADWRSFFESASNQIKGPLRLRRTAKTLSRASIGERLPGYTAPETKSVAINAKYPPWTFNSKSYLLIDINLDKAFLAALSAPGGDDTSDLGAWLHEAREKLFGNHQLQVVYVPWGTSSVYGPKLPYPASWVGVLQSAEWLCAVDGSGPYRPENVLSLPDPARPDEPVADLSADLVRILEQCGVTFGASIAQVASIERLRREGPGATPERLVQLLEAAIVDARENPEYSVSLETVLALPLLPVSAALIDGAARIGSGRLVTKSTRGADLGGWLLSVNGAIDDHDTTDPHTQLLALVASVIAIPETPSWDQALGFLAWVWEKRPDAELVRRFLPRAYRLVAEDLDDAREETWRVAREDAVVYLAGRKWASVKSGLLFLDDLGDDRLRGLASGLLFATLGHLGETRDEQYRTADLLGIQRLSSRFALTLSFEGHRNTPSSWLERLALVVAFLSAVAHEDETEDSPKRCPDVAYFSQITKELIDDGVTTNSWRAHAARDGDRICIAGAPDEFSADLCRVLLQWSGLANRRDLDELAPALTQLLGWLDRPEKFGPRVEELRAQRRFVPSQVEPPETAAADTTAPNGAGPQTPPPPEEVGSPHTSTTPPLTGEATKPREEPDNDPPPQDGNLELPPPSGGYTADHRERRLQSLRKHRAEIDTQLKELLGVAPVPDDPDGCAPGDGRSHKPFASDVAYRQAVVDFERDAGRYAETKDTGQPGYDIDSFDKPLDDPGKRLVRRIEVKGHGCNWTEDETVELSDRQFLDALEVRTDQTQLADDFDYWLYVVERQDDGSLQSLPIRNPARRAAKFEFRAGTWRALAESLGDHV